MFRTNLAQPDAATVASTWDAVRDQLAGRFPTIGTPMDAGTRLFDGVPRSYQLDLVSSTASSNGIVEPQYRRHR